MLLRMPSGAAELAAELALDMIVLGFRTALITGWRYDWNSAIDLPKRRVSICPRCVDAVSRSDSTFNADMFCFVRGGCYRHS
jgi:hypothetical protein